MTAVAATEPEAAQVSLRIRVETDEGVFLVYDAMIPPDHPRPSPGYLAYWTYFASESIYFYDGLVQGPADVGRSLLALERDLSIDMNPIADLSPALAWMLDQPRIEVSSSVTQRGGAAKSTRPTSRNGEPPETANAWHPLTYAGAMAAMGFDLGGVAGLQNPPGSGTVPCTGIAASTKPTQRRNVSDRSSGFQRGVALPPPTAATPRQLITQAAATIPCIPGGGAPPCTGCGCSTDPCCGSSDPCCGNPDPCCNPSDPCCGNPNRCCGTGNPCCGSSDPCCNPSDPCCGNPDPCCNPDNPCCGNPDPCCGSSDPCCGNPDPCCNPSDPCCGNPNRCCGTGNPCCGSPDPCCNTSDPCCGNPDPCCNPDNPCCGNPDPCCGSSDPCCGNPDPCCGVTDPCDPICGDPCICLLPCDDGSGCTTDSCANGACIHEFCPGGAAAAAANSCCPPSGPTCCNNACCSGPCCPGPNNTELCCGPCEQCCGTGCCSKDSACADGVCCDDGNPCTIDESVCADSSCITHVCSHRPACDDGNPCTTDTCSPDPAGCGAFICGTTCNPCAVCPGGVCLSQGTSCTCQPATATLTADPSAIAAKTAWPGMLNNLIISDITVQWTPPGCVGTLKIGDVAGQGGYQPPDSGALQKINDTLWRYTALSEPQNEHCPKPVTVPILAMQGSMEVGLRNILVLPVHTFFTHSHRDGPGTQNHQPNTNDFTNDYNFLVWKYATVLATTGGAFSGLPTISTASCVPCGLSGACVAACTHLNDTVDFGTTAFTQSENAASSTIGHERVHTVGLLNQSECTAYTWEANHSQQTGILLCDAAYLADVLQKQNCECFGCP